MAEEYVPQRERRPYTPENIAIIKQRFREAAAKLPDFERRMDEQSQWPSYECLRTRIGPSPLRNGL